MALLIAIRMVVLIYGIYGGLRARYWPALTLLVPTLAMIVLPLVIVFDALGAHASFVMAAPWVPPLIAAAIGAFVTQHAFTELDCERTESARADALETVGFALLGNTLIDAALFVIAALATVLTSRDIF